MKRYKIVKRDTLLLLGTGIILVIRGIFNVDIYYLSMFLSLTILIKNLPGMSKAYRLPAWIFTIVGLLTMIYSHESINDIAKGISSMLPTVAIVNTIQLLSIPIECGKYDESISLFVRKYAKNEGKLFILIEIVSHLLCSILNLGEVVIVLKTIDDKTTRKIKNYSKFVSKAISMGHCTAFLWAPGSATVLLTIGTFGVQWDNFAAKAFALAIVGILFSGILEYPRLHSKKIETETIHLEIRDRLKLCSICIALFAIVVNTFLFGAIFTSAGKMEILILSVFLVSICWTMFYFSAPTFVSVLKRFNFSAMDKMGGLSAFFISMGIFSAGMQCIDKRSFLPHLWEVANCLPGFVILLCIPIVIALISFVGIHPLVSIALFGPVFAQISANVTVIQLALSTILGCCVSYMISPFAGLVLFLSQQLDIPAKEIAFKYNFFRTLVYYLIGVCIIYFLF